MITRKQPSRKAKKGFRSFQDIREQVGDISDENIDIVVIATDNVLTDEEDFDEDNLIGKHFEFVYLFCE